MRVVFVPYGSMKRRGDPNDVAPPDPPEPKMKRCCHCGGDGRVDTDPDEPRITERCSICNGSGEIPDGDDEGPEPMFDTKEEERGEK